ncbi:hypothetical protein H7X46_00025 [Pseudonocardia sp. C8]|uniref:hypothetical protein n=1 Tax=Pseudonocardia sp. C8 TaxID=2762759 RepID=UPI001642E756|nr:hypothetical protein [Pseudonocardia sp. C8]MBC3189458.1 hypothetical protein [Pseudonocardia sp. C8]
MSEHFPIVNPRIEDGLALSDATVVEFRDGCTDAMSIVPGEHEAGESVPCPRCAGEHEISSALSVPIAHNIEISEVEPEAEPGV